MRSYPHDVDSELVDDDIETTQEILQDMVSEIDEAHDEQNKMMFVIMAEQYMALSAYRYAKGAALDVVKSDLAECARCNAQAMEYGHTLDPYEYIDIVSVAALSGDEGAVKALAGLHRVRYDNPDVDSSETIFDIAAAVSAIARNDLQTLTKMFTDPVASAVDPKKLSRFDRQVYLPRYLLVQAAVLKDQDAFDQARAKRDAEFKKSVADPDEANEAGSLLDFSGLLIATFAVRQGLHVESDVYRPLELTGSG